MGQCAGKEDNGEKNKRKHKKTKKLKKGKKKNSFIAGKDELTILRHSQEAITVNPIVSTVFSIEGDSTLDETHNITSTNDSVFTDVFNEDQSELSSHEPNLDSVTLLSDSPGLDKQKPSPKKMNIFNSPKPLSGPRVLFKSPLPKHLAFRREKNNSTSSLYIKDTINSPNVDEILRCMSVALLYHIKNGMSSTNDDLKHDPVFSEKTYPLTKDIIDLNVLPDVSTIYRFINLIFRVQKLPPECAILCLAYIERVLSGGRIVLHAENWRRALFGSIIIATKVWEDESVWNVDFLDLFPLLTLVNLNNLENRFLELLQFNVLIIGSEYAKYYFELRALSQFDSFPLEPLNKEAQAHLEQRSQKTNEKVSQFTSSLTTGKEMTPRRSRSVDFFDPKSPPAVLQ